MENDSNNHSPISRQLLTDEEFARAMAASFAAEGQSPDELSQRRIWSKVQQRIKQAAPRRRELRPYLVGLSALAAVVIGFVITRPLIRDDETQRIKGTIDHTLDRFTHAQLIGYILQSDQSVRPTTDSALPPDSTLVFGVTATNTGFFAVTVATNNRPPILATTPTALVPGGERRLETDHGYYSYILRAGETVRICILAAPTRALLDAQIAKRLAPPASDATGCRTFASTSAP